jgi:CRP/FNR family cyclic AMP-dependent transcriptional regulator
MGVGVTDLVGYAAAGLVLATFSARSLIVLRVLAIASNVMFIAYAASAQLLPVLILHALLVPINLLRLCQALGAGRARRGR